MEQNCSQCHERHRPAPLNGRAHGDGKDCLGCHKPGTNWKDALGFSHAPLPSSCATCHETDRPAQTQLPIPAAAPVAGHFGTQDCISCHLTQRVSGVKFQFSHQGATGATVTTCLPCHEARRKTPDHYPGQDCASCHTDPAKSWLASSGTPHPGNNPPLNSCSSCHQKDRPAVAKYPPPGSATVSGHYGTEDCFSCHDPKTASLLKFVFNHAANGKARASCLPCHESKRPSLNHYPGQDCATCHTDSTKPWTMPSKSPHPGNNPFPSTCLNCHESKRPLTTKLPTPGGTMNSHFAPKDCQECHAPRSNTVTVFKFDHNANGKSRTSCLPCHEGRRPSANHYPGQDCVSCHLDPAKPWASSVSSPHPQNNPSPTTCAGCHAKDRPTMVQFPAPGLRVSGHFDTVDCFSCHNPKSSTLTVFKFDHNANGVPRTSCLPCHEAKRPTTVINNFSHSIAGTGDCISCHKQPGVTWAGGSYNHDPKPSTCASCHESKRPTSLIGKFSHTNAGECATCHKTPGDSWKGATFNHSPAPSSCTTCHGGARPRALRLRAGSRSRRLRASPWAITRARTATAATSRTMEGP